MPERISETKLLRLLDQLHAAHSLMSLHKTKGLTQYYAHYTKREQEIKDAILALFKAHAPKESKVSTTVEKSGLGCRMTNAKAIKNHVGNERSRQSK